MPWEHGWRCRISEFVFHLYMGQIKSADRRMYSTLGNLEKSYVIQTFWNNKNRAQHFLSFTIISLTTIALYLPFLGNPIIFDDHNFFTNLTIYDHATNPFSLNPRSFPYFTLGFVEVTWKSIEANRIVSLFIHLLNVFILFRLLNKWLTTIGQIPSEKSLSLAFIGSLFFAIHPVAVYGAGYLAQRTILLATLFSALALWFYWRSLERNRITDAISAALFYTLAIYSKEHAIMLASVAFLLTFLYETPWRQNLSKAIIFAALCTPSAILVILATKGVIGTPYEPDSTTFIDELTIPDSPWLVSAVTQMGLFFRYLQNWFIPVVRMMSVDIRVDFNGDWTTSFVLIKAGAFFIFAVAGIALLLRGKKLGLIGWGMLYFWLLYATELVSIRFQEPFVLYRSYLWAPGIILIFITLLAGVSTRLLISCSLVIAPLLFLSAQDRLRSMSSELSLWVDAANKLPSASTPGSYRIYFNRGNQYLKAKRYLEAISDFNTSLEISPKAISYQQRGVAYYSLLDYQHALSDFNGAIALDDSRGSAHYGRALSLEKLGYEKETIIEYQKSSELGYVIADLALKKYQDMKNKDILKEKPDSQ